MPLNWPKLFDDAQRLVDRQAARREREASRALGIDYKALAERINAAPAGGWVGVTEAEMEQLRSTQMHAEGEKQLADYGWHKGPDGKYIIPPNFNMNSEHGRLMEAYNNGVDAGRRQGKQEGRTEGQAMGTLGQHHFAMLIELMAAQAKRLQDLQAERDGAIREMMQRRESTPINTSLTVDCEYESSRAGLKSGDALWSYVDALEKGLDDVMRNHVPPQVVHTIRTNLGWSKPK